MYISYTYIYIHTYIFILLYHCTIAKLVSPETYPTISGGVLSHGGWVRLGTPKSTNMFWGIFLATKLTSYWGTAPL